MIVSTTLTWEVAIMLLSTSTANLHVPDEIKSVLYHRTKVDLKISTTGDLIPHTLSRLSCAVKATSNGAQGHVYAHPHNSCQIVTSISSGSKSDWPVYWSPDAVDIKVTTGSILSTDIDSEDAELVLVTTGGYLYYIFLTGKKVLFETRFNGRHALKAYYDDDERALIVLTPSHRITISVDNGKVTRTTHQYNFSDVVNLEAVEGVTAILRRKHLEILEGHARRTVKIQKARPQTLQISQEKRAVYWSSMLNEETTVTETFFTGEEGDVYHAKATSMASFAFRNGDESMYLWGLDGMVRLTKNREFPVYSVKGECFSMRPDGSHFDTLMVKDDHMALVKFIPLSRMMPRREDIPLDQIPEDAGKWTLERLPRLNVGHFRP